MTKHNVNRFNPNLVISPSPLSSGLPHIVHKLCTGSTEKRLHDLILICSKEMFESLERIVSYYRSGGLRILFQ